MSAIQLHERPVLGLVVEGWGEHDNLPGVACRVVGQSLNIKVPRPQGNGKLRNRLVDEIRDLVIVYKPYWVMAVLDLKDALEDGTYSDCSHLLETMRAQVDSWISGAGADARLQPLPLGISIVLEIPEFESWLVADCEGLAHCTLVDEGKCHHDCTNVDVEINPDQWLHACLRERIDTKRRQHVREFASVMDPQRARARSRSFDKFCRDVESACSRYYRDLTGCSLM